MIVEKKVVVETQASAGGRSGRSGKWDWRRPTTCLVLAFVSLLELISSVQHTAGALIDLNVFFRRAQRSEGCREATQQKLPAPFRCAPNDLMIGTEDLG
jgi:hypothetical protein